MRARPSRMGAPPGPRAANVAATRHRIVTVASTHFARNGYNGARIEAICADAEVNARMVYHYFTDKAGLYVAVLEHVLGRLRADELKLDFSRSPPLEGLLTLFDFIFNHFSSHPELIRLLSAENLLQGAFLKDSVAVPKTASPVVEQIDGLLRRGEAAGDIRPGVDALHLYIVMVGLSYFHEANSYTLSIIWKTDFQSAGWKSEHRRLARDMLQTYLSP